MCDFVCGTMSHAKSSLHLSVRKHLLVMVIKLARRVHVN